ncbi:hypothetical protein SKAU_G00133990 [Synaphobranchus kaupii]|uniref:Uncharacterized protein n=1 Tax=Synaphobranchus kaupii TaxID=118154 RepID=A0A9Q1FRY1_SYNKA|nr:hypothetical protein SKAU_G00133990 [Synaphobranchus kaupii]
MLEPSDMIREVILSTLPSIPEESLGRMVAKLIHQGAETEEDLQYVREQVIEEFIRPIQCRKRLDAWKHKENQRMQMGLHHNEDLQTLTAAHNGSLSFHLRRQEDKRQKMMELFSREGSSGMERAEVLKLMEATYYLQRQMINANPVSALEDVKLQWPYLFFPRSMCTHFERLTKVTIVRKIEAFLEEHGRNIMEFFKQNPTNDDVKAVLYKTDCSMTASNILQVLMAHFKEPLDALIIQSDVSATPAIVQLTVPLADTPCLIEAGKWSDPC